MAPFFAARSVSSWPAPPSGASGFSTEQMNAVLEKIARHRQMMRGRHHDRGGIDEIEQRPIIGKGLRVVAPGDGLGLFEIDVGDADQLDLRQTGENACVFLAEMPDADHRCPQAFHAAIPMVSEPAA